MTRRLALPTSEADAVWRHLSDLERAELNELLALEDADRPQLSLRQFVAPAWAVVEPAVQFRPNWHIDAICEHLEAVTQGELQHLVVNMPPRFMKSLLISVFWFCWAWTFQPWSRWLFASYAETLSVRDSLKCRRILDSPWYQGRWGHRVAFTRDQNQKTRFENMATGFRLSTSTDGHATGEGGDVVVIDDPHNVRKMLSDAGRANTVHWLDQVMSTRLNDPETGHRVIVMQRLHEQDAAGHVLAQGGYHHLCLPNEYDPRAVVAMPLTRWQDPRMAEGELLWPSRFGPRPTTDAKLRLGSYGYAGQYQQRPAPSEGGIFKRVWWRFWQPAGVQLQPVEWVTPEGVVQVQPVTLPALPFQAQSWDMAFKETADSDYVVGQCWGRRGGDGFLLDQVRDRLDFPGTVRAVKAFSGTHPAAGAKWVEDKANGPAVIATLRQQVPGLIACQVEGDKVARARAVSPYCESGNVYLPHPQVAPWVLALIEELAVFPNGTHDDQVDALTQALRRLLGTMQSGGMYASESYISPE